MVLVVKMLLNICCKGIKNMKKKYVLRKEIKEELIQLGIDILGIVFMVLLVIFLILLNGIMFQKGVDLNVSK